MITLLVIIHFIYLISSGLTTTSPTTLTLTDLNNVNIQKISQIKRVLLVNKTNITLITCNITLEAPNDPHNCIQFQYQVDNNYPAIIQKIVYFLNSSFSILYQTQVQTISTNLNTTLVNYKNLTGLIATDMNTENINVSNITYPAYIIKTISLINCTIIEGTLTNSTSSTICNNYTNITTTYNYQNSTTYDSTTLIQNILNQTTDNYYTIMAHVYVQQSNTSTLNQIKTYIKSLQLIIYKDTYSQELNQKMQRQYYLYSINQTSEQNQTFCVPILKFTSISEGINLTVCATQMITCVSRFINSSNPIYTGYNVFEGVKYQNPFPTTYAGQSNINLSNLSLNAAPYQPLSPSQCTLSAAYVLNSTNSAFISAYTPQGLKKTAHVKSSCTKFQNRTSLALLNKTATCMNGVTSFKCKKSSKIYAKQLQLKQHWCGDCDATVTRVSQLLIYRQNACDNNQKNRQQKVCKMANFKYNAANKMRKDICPFV